MRIFILFSNIIVPIIMICIGVLYNRSSNKKVNRILGLFMPTPKTCPDATILPPIRPSERRATRPENQSFFHFSQ